MKLTRIIKNIIGKLIELIEKYEYRHSYLNEDDISKKIIQTNSLKIKVDSDTGLVETTHIHKTQPYTVYSVILENGLILEAADNHIVFRENGDIAFIKHLKIGDPILTKYGKSKVVSVDKLPYRISMSDLSVDSVRHTYYTNGVLSHNTTTVSAFISWMLVFHADRNILVVANKEATATEIVNKITMIFKGLPYFLKPGCISFGKTSISLENGSRLISSATTNTASIGFTIHCILLDEFAHIPENIVDNFWRSVYPTLSSSKISQCIITSTPNGTTNKFYEIWSGALDGRNSFLPIRTDYWEVPSHDDAWAAKMKADFGEEEFAQEFELQFNINSKMLLKASDLVFIDKLSKDYVHKEIYTSSFSPYSQYLNDDNLYWHPNFDPNEIEEKDKFVFLVDLAEGTGQPDKMFKNKKKTPDSNTVTIFKVVPNSIANMKRYSNISCTVGDAFRFIQVGRYDCNSQDEIYCGNVCAALAYDLMKDDDRTSVRIMVEMNFNGKSFLQAVMKHPNYCDGTILRTYHTKPIPGERQRRRLGFKTTSNKEHYCLRGNKLIGMRRIIPTDSKTFTQMKSFGYVRGKLMGIACHDDLSMPVFNHIPRMLDESTFIEWLDDILYNLEDENLKYNINELLEKYDMDNPEIEDSTFDAMYNSSSGPTNVFEFNPYTNISINTQSMNPYSENNFR